MQLRILAQGQYIVSSILKKGKCPVFDNPLSTNSNYDGQHAGLVDLIRRIADNGLDNMPVAMSHLVNTRPKILELRRGKLRLFYFHGHENRIVVCTELIQKKKQTVDKKAVKRAIAAYDEYYNSLKNGTLIDIGDDHDS